VGNFFECAFFDKPWESALRQLLESELCDGGPTPDLQAWVVAELPGFREAEILQEQ